MVMEDDAFVTSLSLTAHPLLNVRGTIKTQYYDALAYCVTHLSEGEHKFFSLRLRQYREFLLGKDSTFSSNPEKSLRAIIDCRLQPWRKKYRYMFLCDIALITQAELTIRKAAGFMKERLSPKQHLLLDKVVDALLVADYADFSLFPYIEGLVKQYHANQVFLRRIERRIIVAANMSAGKSTLINALIGKRVARTSLEACTGNVCYIYNKPYEDGHTHLSTATTDLDATQENLSQFDWQTAPSIATYFRISIADETRLCIIDTPGVNSALNKAHNNIAKNALKNEDYDTLVYVIKGTDLGTDAEINYLKWISENIPHEKIIFVLNRLDEFRAIEDDIETSLSDVQADLKKLGFENPTVCPFSAYFSYLIQLTDSGEPLSADETDEYEYLVRKFKKDPYDLSKFYCGKGAKSDAGTAEDMRARSGLSGVERIIFAGGQQ